MDAPRAAKKQSVKKKTEGKPTQWQRRLGRDEAEAIQWLTRSSDSSKGEDNKKKEATTKGNEEGEAADDEASKDCEVTPQNETIEDIATSTHLTSENVDPGEQSLLLRRKLEKKIVPK
ncbi:hypothetical protein PVK06_024254 [Gossypium arboreum]|uniref:Uncharacterized protein n=1 Tax=Gossypium arboreum TaxID=29729 RepID=A0ABR0PDA0_GOSAR|nr:hypothetical protein PVK06_024254 [Gossypium arboreum]